MGNVLVALGSIGLVILGAAAMALNISTEEREAKARQAKRAAENEQAILTHDGCGGKAYPVRGSRNGYKCIKCGGGFNSVYHNLPN